MSQSKTTGAKPSGRECDCVDERVVTVGQFLTLSLIWGGSFPAIAIGLRSLEPVVFAAFRYDIAAVVLLGYVVVRGADWVPTEPRNRRAVVAGGVFLISPNALLFVGQQTVPSGVAAILQSLVPIVTVLWALFVLPDERVSRAGVVGIGFGIVGVGLIVRPDPATVLSTGIGRLLILGQVAGVALGGVLIQRLEPTMNRAAMAGWSMGIGGVLLHLVSVLVGESLRLPATDESWFAVGYLGVVATGVAFVLYFTLLARRGAFETSLVSYLVPVVASVVGVVVLNESITPLSVVGFLVVCVGFLLLKRRAVSQLAGTVRTELRGS